METQIKIELTLNQSTFAKMDEIINYGKFRSKYLNECFPLSYEDIIKAALYEYFRKIEIIYSNVLNIKTLKLKSNGTLQNTIKEYIKDVEGLRQIDFAELSGIDEGSLSNILSNRNQPSMDLFLRIWVTLGCPPIEDLFYRKDE